MTKYILAGGNDKWSDEYGTQLAKEVCQILARPISILSCFFADPLRWQRELRAQDWEPWFIEFFGSDIVYDYARPGTFLSQIQVSDVIYLHGGDNETILKNLRTYSRLQDVWSGKIVIGSLRWCQLPCTAVFWTRSNMQVKKGSAILPVNIMVHYGSKDSGINGGPVDWGEAEVKMGAAVGTGKILRIREGTFVVIEA